MKEVLTIEEAREHFAGSSDAVVCKKDGADDLTATSLEQAEEYYAS